MIRSLDHIAIAVPELDAAIQRFAEALGIPLHHVEDVPSAQTRTAFHPVSGPTTIELVAPLNGAGPIATSLDKRGPGIHHLCFRTDDLDGDMARLRDRGWKFTTEEPTSGAHGTRVIFVHPRSTGGVLIELAEYPSEASDAS